MTVLFCIVFGPIFDCFFGSQNLSQTPPRPCKYLAAFLFAFAPKILAFSFNFVAMGISCTTLKSYNFVDFYSSFGHLSLHEHLRPSASLVSRSPLFFPSYPYPNPSKIGAKKTPKPCSLVVAFLLPFLGSHTLSKPFQN